MLRNLGFSIAAVFAASTAFADSPPDAVLLAQLTGLRDAFVSQIRAEGFKPSLPPPTLVLDNPPSYGNSQDDRNLLHIAVWSALTPEQQSRFSRLAARLGKGQTGEQAFEDGVHHWVFVHELGHWWQACGHLTGGSNHYSVEYGANRIAAAYWRLKDPAFMQRTAEKMTLVHASMPNPVPEGQAREKFFDANYEQLGPTPGYIWFQYGMVLDVQGEKPLPSLKQTLQNPTYP
jgi:hypothetical protein